MIQNKSIPQQRTVRITVKVMKGPHTLKGAEVFKEEIKTIDYKGCHDDEFMRTAITLYSVFDSFDFKNPMEKWSSESESGIIEEDGVWYHISVKDCK